MKPEKNRNFIATIIATIIAIFVLFPFFLVVINSAKSSADIVISPINLPKHWGQMIENMKNVWQPGYLVEMKRRNGRQLFFLFS